MTCCNYTKGCALSWAMPTSLWDVKLILQYLCIDMFGNVNWGVKTNQCYPGEMWTYLAQKLLHNTVGSLLVTCNFKLTGKVTLNSLCPWKPQVHTKVNHILEHHVKALAKNQKCIMRRKKYKMETWPRNFLLVTGFSKTLARCCTFKTKSCFHWVACLQAPVKQLGSPGTALTGLMFFTQKPRL